MQPLLRNSPHMHWQILPGVRKQLGVVWVSQRDWKAAPIFSPIALVGFRPHEVTYCLSLHASADKAEPGPIQHVVLWI